MSPSESRSGSNPNRVRFFGPDKLVRGAAEKRWDRIKIVCSQPYSKVPEVGAGEAGLWSWVRRELRGQRELAEGSEGWQLVSPWDYEEARKWI